MSAHFGIKSKEIYSSASLELKMVRAGHCGVPTQLQTHHSSRLGISKLEWQ
ncbi:hypothetical protein ACE1CD_05985 [Aerosakkonema sp. BLCC-F183]|uniref:hypothetical protein n=1 Tax=Aerosakkonema sp. BLCC-F183 TaxID=3342834 RepID=UPI0035B9E0B8